MKYKLLLNAGYIFNVESDSKGFSYSCEGIKINFIDFAKQPDWFQPVIERWRAPNLENYFFVDNTICVSVGAECYDFTDGYRFKSGNYFETESQATEAAKRIKQTLMDYHKELASEL